MGRGGGVLFERVHAAESWLAGTAYRTAYVFDLSFEFVLPVVIGGTHLPGAASLQNFRDGLPCLKK